MAASGELLHFIHTAEFDDSWERVPLSDADLERLQNALRADPEVGAVIAGTGGARKYRVPARGRGTRGGARVIYYYVVLRSTVYLLVAYAKGDSDDISQAGKKHLRRLALLLDEEDT